MRNGDRGSARATGAQAHPGSLLGAAILCGVLACGAGAPGEADGGQEVQAVPLAATRYSGLERSARIVIRDEREWTRYRETLASSSDSTIPPVDFEREMVILVAMGQRPTGGYEIEVSQVVRADSLLTVTVTEATPGRSCMTTQAFTAPAVAVRVPRFAGQVRFSDVQRTRECG